MRSLTTYLGTVQTKIHEARRYLIEANKNVTAEAIRTIKLPYRKLFDINSKKTKSKYTPNELEESSVFPVKLNKKQQKQANDQLITARKKLQEGAKDSDRLRAGILQLRFQIEEYLKENTFQPEMILVNMLKRYVLLQNKKRKVFEISIDDTLLSQFINQHRTPPDYIMIRLELHSSNLIPADLWYQLIERKRENFIRTDQQLRRTEKQHVKAILDV